MKTIKIIAVFLTAALLSISFNSNSFSSYKDMDCNCCGEQCKEAKCCTEVSGSSQGNSDCCTDKCTSEECKKNCASGSCSMKENNSGQSSIDQNTVNAEAVGNMDNTDIMDTKDSIDKSCCSDKSNTGNKNKDCSK